MKSNGFGGRWINPTASFYSMRTIADGDRFNLRSDSVDLSLMERERSIMSNAWILSGARTPIGRFLGELSHLTAPQLAGYAIRAAVKAARVDQSRIEEVIMGEVLTSGVGQAPARQAALYADIPDSVGCSTVGKVCGSGLYAIMLADRSHSRRRQFHCDCWRYGEHEPNPSLAPKRREQAGSMGNSHSWTQSKRMACVVHMDRH